MGIGSFFAPALNLLGENKTRLKFSGIPVFIGGCPRSGTTLLLSILSSHPDLYCIPAELRLFNQWAGSEPLNMYRLHRFVLTHRIPDGKRMCEKSPSNIRYFDKINEYYHGEVKLIQIVRDGRDVVLSRHPKNPSQGWVKPERWIMDIRYGLKFRDLPNVDTIKYEDLVLHYEVEIRQLCAFLELPVREELLDWHSNSRIRKADSLHGAISKLSESSIGKWKPYAAQAGAVKEMLDREEAQNLLSMLGY